MLSKKFISTVVLAFVIPAQAGIQVLLCVFRDSGSRVHPPARPEFMSTNLRDTILACSPRLMFLLESDCFMDPASRTTLADRLDGLVDWLYPPRCRACGSWIAGRDAEYFCRACWPQIRLVGHPLCNHCGRPFFDTGGEDHHCAACLIRPPHFTRARAWGCYPRDEITDHPLRVVVQKFKYGRKVSLGKPLGRLLAQGCREFLEADAGDLIVPVPLHPKRLRWRGFNQSLLLARQVSRLYEVPVDPFVLYRERETPPQTQLTEDERRKNVRGAFATDPEKVLKDKKVLLVDDVYTSGATVNECSRMLLRGGAREVNVLTLARTI
jgi:ComF family protein